MKLIILLRGINVGRRTIKMHELKSCFTENGFADVQTVLQTGNVLAETTDTTEAAATRRIENMLERHFQYPARVLALKPKALERILAGNPFTESDPTFHRYIVFTKDGYNNELFKSCASLTSDNEKIENGCDVLYWTVPKGLTLDSAFAKLIAKAANKEFITTRNVNTLEKLLKR